MKNRLVLVINPRSSGYSLVHEKIVRNINRLNLAENQRMTYEIQTTNPLDNAEKMAKLLQDDDTVLVAGGDGTAHIATNAIIFSNKTGVKIKYTGFGNFNDYAHSFSGNNSRSCLNAIKDGKVVAELKPLKIYINDEFYRLAPLYATVGLTAEMAEIFEHPKVRGALKITPGRNTRLILSLLAATRFYFNHRRTNILNIKNIGLDGDECIKNKNNITDIVFMNGPRMARIMRSRANKLDDETFGFTALNAGDFRKNLPFITKGFFSRIPLRRTKNAKIEFTKPTKIAIQIEGEAVILPKVKTLEARIAEFEISVL